MRNFKKGGLFILILFFLSLKIAGKAPSSIEECWRENEKCMSSINTFSQKTVDNNWLRQYAPEKIREKLPLTDTIGDSKITSSTKWKVASVEGKIHIESLNESSSIKEKKENLPSMSNEEWAEHCNKLFKKCESSPG